MRRFPAGLSIASGAALAHAAAAGAGTIFLLSPIAPVEQPPPLLPRPTAVRTTVETRFPRHLDNREVVTVGVDRRGSPTSIVVKQRVLVIGSGDYSFVIPGPVLKVTAGPGSETAPGLRDLGIVWQGFADRDRVLAVIATVDTAEGAKGLPLRISVEQRGGTSVVRLTNGTRREVNVSGGSASRASLRSTLARLRLALRQPGGKGVSGIWQVNGEPGGQIEVAAVAPLRVRGTISTAGGAPIEVSVLFGDGHPLEQTIVLPGGGAPRLNLRVDLLTPLEILPDPAELTGARDPLLAVQSALARTAVSWQYGQFLASPDALGKSSTTYLYRTVAAAPAVMPASAPGGGGDWTLAIVLAVTLGTVALIALTVVWAHH